jgi:predicted  nucleic acid-binding Zn-ribbon protein
VNADRPAANVERELSEPSRTSGADQFDTSEDAEIDNSTAGEDNAQQAARSSPATAEEIDAARRKMDSPENDIRDEPGEERPERRPKRGRGTPQGPPTEEPDDAAAQEFGLDGPVGGPDQQPPTTEPTQPDSEAETIDGSATDLSALREELNDQFESIKITAPGQYELNLMELYDRKEYIISLQEDGRYIVDIPEGHEFRED